MKKIILSIFLTALMLSSCKDFLNMPPKNLKVVYKIDDVRQAMTGFLYAIQNTYDDAVSGNFVRYNKQIIINPMSRHSSVLCSMLADDFEMLNFTAATPTNVNRGGKSYEKEYKEAVKWESYTFANRIWTRTFNAVGYLNSVLRDLENVPDYNKEIAERISGEARVIRAYYLLKLNQLFAPYDRNDLGIPYNLDANIYSGSNRHKQTDIYKELISELTDVLEYTTPARPTWNVFYNKRVIYGILAQIYLYKAESCAKESTDWANAKKYAQMARNGEAIENTLDAQNMIAYVPAAREKEIPSQFCLIRFNMTGDSGSTGGNDYAPWGHPDFLVQRPSESLYALYEAEDIRLTSYFFLKEGEPYIQKCKPLGASWSYCFNLFRHSEMLLIEAEAMARMGESGALELLNEFKRAKIKGYTGYKGNDLIAEILVERRKEFCFEQQTRWLDMKRTGASFTRKVDNLDTKEIEEYSLESNDYRYTLPIPASEFTYNPIPQNPGW